MRIQRFGMLSGALCLLTLPAPRAVPSTDRPPTLKVAVVQLGQEPTLQENRDKIVRLTGAAAATGARLVVFPEGALAAPPGVSRDDYQAAVAAVGRAAREHRVYVVTGSRYVAEGQAKHRNQLHVFGPRGETLLVYDKDAFAHQPGDPKLVEVDGVPCSFILCSDRWSRPVESLPPILGARIIIECSNNYDTEWLPELQWYWYAPRAVRNTAHVIFANTARENRVPGGQRGHGHSAVIAPDGTLLAAAADERDRILTADLDLGRATRDMALRRSRHPLFKDWWDMGRAIHAGKEFPLVETPPKISSSHSVKCGFAVMACSASIQKNVEAMRTHLRQARNDGLDLVVFPELAVTGDREEDLRKADPQALDAAVDALCRSAREHRLTVVFGAPSHVGGERRNSAYAIGPDGTILTRYDQIVVGRPELFQGGRSTKAMWFQVNGVWSILTIGDDVIWNEMAELAALRGARLHCHLSHRRNRSPAEALLHEQLVAVFASYRMLTVASNPLFPELQTDADARFSVGSGIWDDLEAGNWCAVKTHAGRPWEKVFSAARLVPGPANPVRQTGYWRKGSPQYRSWMMAGAAAMDRELP
jgi:predicted amidohydrolase